jgi:hypothetical protein
VRDAQRVRAQPATARDAQTVLAQLVELVPDRQMAPAQLAAVPDVQTALAQPATDAQTAPARLAAVPDVQTALAQLAAVPDAQTAFAQLAAPPDAQLVEVVPVVLLERAPQEPAWVGQQVAPVLQGLPPVWPERLPRALLSLVPAPWRSSALQQPPSQRLPPTTNFLS